MFRIFNGEWRGLDGSDKAVWGQFDVEFRRQLHYFKGANLAVFLAITLHCNEEGWAWPGASLLAQETGYNVSTVRTAIRELCKLRIDGRRVLAKYQPRKVASDNEESEQDKAGKFATNHYLIFPSDEEAAACETKGVKPGAHLPLVGKSLTTNRLSGKLLTKKEPVLKKEPKPLSKKQKRKPKLDPLEDALERALNLPDDTPIERIIAATAIALQVDVPRTDYQLKPYNHFTDAVVEWFNRDNGKRRKPLSHDQASEVVQAIEWCVTEATRNGSVGYPWNGSSVTAPMVNQVVTALSTRPWQGRQSMDALPNAAEDPAYLAWLSKQKGEASECLKTLTV